MPWYVSYRSGTGATIMYVYPSREAAIDAACRFIAAGHDADIEVGPMLGSEDVLRREDLRRICSERRPATG